MNEPIKFIKNEKETFGVAIAISQSYSDDSYDFFLVRLEDGSYYFVKVNDATYNG